ncbi:terminase large subunit [Bacillus safensis]|uniref:terminase large subunit n=1 Tax=Bacillus safensis TaxID=561879 RepID=UPI002E1B9EB5|nr:terminase large subunit [Bacillus safensis]
MIEKGKNYAQEYADKVLKNKKLHCKTEIQAVERYLRMKKKKGIRLDVDRANWAMDFIETFCKYKEGEVAGQNIRLTDWEKFNLTCIFGFVKKNRFNKEVRVIRTSYIQIPRKNDKTTLAGGVGNYMLFGDGELGAECFCAATERAQADIAASKMISSIENSPDLKSRSTIYKNSNKVIYSYTIDGKKFENTFKPLSKNTTGLDGFNPHFVLLDEVHAHGNADIYDVLKSGMGSRSQPLMFIISTAGKGATSVGLQIYEYAKQVLRETHEDDSWWVYITEPDKGDKWDDPAVWRKVNVNYNVSVDGDYLQERFKEAQLSDERKDEFMAKHLNVFVRSTGTYFDKDIVGKMILDDNGEIIRDIGDYSGSEVVLGLDLSKTTDLTCVSINIPTHDDSGRSRLVVKQMYFIPDHNIEGREKTENIPYRQMAEKGFLTFCPGRSIDYDMVIRYMIECAQMYDVIQVNYDPALSEKIIESLEAEGFTCVEVKQYGAVLNSPWDDAEVLMYEGRIKTDNPLFIYCIENVVAEKNYQGLKRPSKKQSKNKIDGFSAFLTAHKETMMMMEDYNSDEYEAMLDELYR